MLSTRSQKMVTGVVIVTLALFAGGYAVSTQHQPEPTADTRPTTITHETRSRQLHTPDPALLAPMPSDLAGVEPEIELTMDADGNLDTTPELRQMFDFYLSNVGDEPLDRVMERINALLSRQLDGPALAQAHDLLARYVDYRLALDSIGDSLAPVETANGFDLAALQSRYDTLNSLREKQFSEAESDAFFALEDVQDRYMLEKLKLEQNTVLSEQGHEQALAILEQSLPEPIRLARERATRDADLYVKTQSMSAEGKSAEEIYQARASVVGDEAATRLARLDDKQNQWKNRLSQYASERNDIRDAGLSPDDQKNAIKALRTRLFEGTERLRVKALDPEL
ncbi:lipase secretion chaperone [Marinobacter sp.]|uniref:lipase secretion chaperone n=1 Tax=Marinobacter sp. TaxID=50741 RepID=UPI003A94CF42